MHLIRTLTARGGQIGPVSARFILPFLALLGASFLLSGGEGMLLTLGLGLAFWLGRANGATPAPDRVSAEPVQSGAISAEALRNRLVERMKDPATAQSAFLLVLEIDGFATLVDRIGKDMAARIDQSLFDRLGSNIRGEDRIARTEPGQWAVLFSAHVPSDLEAALQTALRLQALGNDPLRLDGCPARVTLSGGFATGSRLDGARTADAMNEAALSALAAARRAGPRNLRAYDRGMEGTGGRGKGADTLDLASAIARNDIVPWFQPQISTETGAVTGFEVLARYAHPDLGVLPPAEFLPQVRRQGLARRLTQSILDQALGHLAEWKRAGLDLPRVSVNFGAEDLADPALPDRIAWSLDRVGLSAENLGIEVLETVVADADGGDVTSRNLLELGRMGCLIDMDDFGTGYASINSIRQMGIQRLKIDRSLVSGLDSDRVQHGMVAAILTMAGQLGIDVLAEGVETPDEHAAVSDLGCAHVQGFAIARPMPAGDLIGWVKRNQARARPTVHPTPPQTPQPRHTVAQGQTGGETA